jgi:hypothetical protein
MDDKALEAQFSTLLKLDDENLHRELVSLLAHDEEFLKSQALPATEPPGPASQAFAALSWSERIRRAKRAIEDGWNTNKDRLYELICIKFRYCNQKAGGENQASVRHCFCPDGKRSYPCRLS